MCNVFWPLGLALGINNSRDQDRHGLPQSLKELTKQEAEAETKRSKLCICSLTMWTEVFWCSSLMQQLIERQKYHPRRSYFLTIWVGLICSIQIALLLFCFVFNESVLKPWSTAWTLEWVCMFMVFFIYYVVSKYCSPYENFFADLFYTCDGYCNSGSLFFVLIQRNQRC